MLNENFSTISGTAAELAGQNTVLEPGQLAVETDTGLFKVGDGKTLYAALAYTQGGYKVYTARLTQSGTAAPVATVFENTLGGTIVWTRFGQGVYNGTLAGAFPANKTIFFTSQDAGQTSIYRDTNDLITYERYTNAGAPDDSHTTYVEIRVYP